MNKHLKAFSFEQDPHIIVMTLGRPGDTDKSTSLSFLGQYSPGKDPKAGLLTRAFCKRKYQFFIFAIVIYVCLFITSLFSSLNTFNIAGWLYPIGIEEICMKISKNTLPSTSVM